MIEVPWWRGRYGGYMLRLDPEMVQPVHNKRFPHMEYKTNIKIENDPDYQKDQYRGHLGLKVRQVKRLNLWKFS